MGLATALAASQARVYDRSYTDQLDRGELKDAEDDYDARESARRALVVRGIATGGAAVLGGAGLVLTVRAFKGGRAGPKPEWHPETMHAFGTAAPSAEPAAE